MLNCQIQSFMQQMSQNIYGSATCKKLDLDAEWYGVLKDTTGAVIFQYLVEITSFVVPMWCLLARGDNKIGNFCRIPVRMWCPLTEVEGKIEYFCNKNVTFCCILVVSFRQT